MSRPVELPLRRSRNWVPDASEPEARPDRVLRGFMFGILFSLPVWALVAWAVYSLA